MRQGFAVSRKPFVADAARLAGHPVYGAMANFKHRRRPVAEVIEKLTVRAPPDPPLTSRAKDCTTP